MLSDEDAYNLDSVLFHYCFLQLENTEQFFIIKENFTSNLLSKILNKINLIYDKETKNIIFKVKRPTSDDGLYIEFERSGCDVMSAYFNKK